MAEASPKRQKITWLSQVEWVLKRPDSFLGPVEVGDVRVLLPVQKGGSWSAEEVVASMSPALLVLFGEAVTNAVDNSRRDRGQRWIRIRTEEDGTLSVSNDGDTVPISMHETGKWSPSVAFGEFNAGSNFDDGESRTTAGRNGVGITGANAWSRRFEVEIRNAKDKKAFSQEWRANMSVCDEAKVTPFKLKRSETRVTFLPDYERLGMKEVGEEVRRVLSSLAFHASLCSPPSVTVWLNGEKVGLQTPSQFLAAFGVEGNVAADEVRVGEEAVFRLACAAREEGRPARTEAFVNGVRCCEGSHVKMVLGKVADIVVGKARGKEKDVAVRPCSVKEEVSFVLTCLVPNPRFASQLKTCLDTPLRCLGFGWDPSPSFRSAVERSPLVDRALATAREEKQRSLEKSTKQTRASASQIPKYEPALHVGKKGVDCNLLVTEGDSAKTLAVAGLSVVGRQKYGVFPLLGKLLNARKMSPSRILANSEIASLVKILGLEWGVTYDASNVGRVRYRHLIVFSDQDIDGAHIGGLIINFLHACWPSLLTALPDFVLRFATPIVRVTPKGERAVGFFSEVEYARWCEERSASGLPCGPAKYYKGLGTSTQALAREYFSDLDKHVITLRYGGEECDEALRLFFDEKRSGDRKEYLSSRYDPTSFLDYSLPETSVATFIYDEMSHFSAADNVRSIPSCVDGLKVTQRKVLFSLMRTDKEVKVASAMGTIASETAYHHGEASLATTMINMAQDFVGSNNCSLLVPEGMFGTRHTPKAAAPRYIFTRVDPLTRSLFSPKDTPILEHATEDGAAIEPVVYYPLVPLVLCNGASGIGTGWSTFCPCFDPAQVVETCLLLAEGGEESAGFAEKADSLLPWYRGFSGTIVGEGDGSFTCRGTYDVLANGTVRVTELPIGKSTDDYCEFARAKLLLPTGFATELTNESLGGKVDVRLKSSPERLASLDMGKELRIETKLSLSNIVLFDAEGRLRKFTVREVFLEHARARLAAYARRISHSVREEERCCAVARNKRRFIEAVLEGSLDLRSFEDVGAVDAHLEKEGYERLPSFEYLHSMRMSSVTRKRAEALRLEEEKASASLKRASEATPVQEWKEELLHLKEALKEYESRKETAKRVG